MKKDYITLVDVGDPDRELTALEVFYLKEPNKPAGNDADLVAFGAYTKQLDDGWDDPLADPIPSYVCNDEGEVTEINGCCPVGPKGESGPRGIDEERMYPLLLSSLKKFSECEVDLSRDSACEVLADGITKKIIKYMWGKGD